MRIRLATKEDISDINQFYNQQYRAKRTESQWDWEYGTKSLNESLFAIALDDEKIVGTQALIPIGIIMNNEVILTAKSEETLIDPAYRGRGIFEELYDFLIPLARQAGISFIWGFTPAVKPFNRVGFQSPLTTEQFFAPLSQRESIATSSAIQQTGRLKQYFYKCVYPIAVIRYKTYSLIKSKLMPSSSNCSIEEIFNFSSDIKLLSYTFSKRWEMPTVYRSKEYLTWRILNNPYCKSRVFAFFHKGKILGVICFSVTDNLEGYVVDFLAAPSFDCNIEVDEVLSRLLSTAAFEMKKNGAVSIRGWCFGSSEFSQELKRVYKKLGFLHIRKGEPLVVYSIDNDLMRTNKFSESYLSRILTEGILG
jgi:N-acetylglutamate synthase-like GNAT family acetyltransferase